MDISKYINKLLYQHECVILPDFGGFVSNYHSAKIDFKNNSFYPPRKNILFNRQLIQNDGLLINYIARVENIDYSESKELVTGFVKTSNEKLRNGNRASFDGIGTFHFDENKNLQFEPDISTNFLLESYGFSSFHFPAIDESLTKIKRKDIAFTDLKPSSVNRKKILKRVLIASPMILALGFLPVHQKVFKNGQGKEILSLSPVALFSKHMPENTKAKKVEKSLPINITYHNLENAFTAFKKNNDQTVEFRYFIIGASCRYRNEAERVSNEIRNKGFDSFILDPNKGRHRIALEGFENKAEALEKLSLYRKKGFPTAWIWSKK